MLFNSFSFLGFFTILAVVWIRHPDPSGNEEHAIPASESAHPDSIRLKIKQARR